MAKPLVIVESPGKIKALQKYLGNAYQVEASMGHVRDLPEKSLSVDVENDFRPAYRIIPERKSVIQKLKQAVKDAPVVYLASDPDREGEAIAWHLAEALKLKEPRRIQFNEITEQAVLQAIRQPRAIDMNRVNAQQARRILDRLIGYQLSPLLSRKIQRGLSAGRVQSVAVRLICEREREIREFVPEEYWTLTAFLTPVDPEPRFEFPARLHSRGGQKLEPRNEDAVAAIIADLEGAAYTVAEVRKSEKRRNPPSPFITSTLQQEASRKLGMSARTTMRVAQELYEGIELGPQGSTGLITYMRTDSVRVAAEAQDEARRYITEKYGPAYLPPSPRQFKTRGLVQDAHEAIRPTSTFREPDSIAQYLSAEQLALYRLIWQRFVASQMQSAVLDVTTVNIHAAGPGTGDTPYLFRATGTTVKFDGFTRVYVEGRDTDTPTEDEQPPLPPLTPQQLLDLIRLEPRQHFTEPPPRYTEATLVKALEERGIGRPSTYASILSTIRDRGYVDLQGRSFVPTELGFKVTDQLIKHFPDIMDVGFTAEMETRLDEIEEGKVEWVGLLRQFYGPFAQSVATAKTAMEKLRPEPVETEYHCPRGKVMLLRQGRYGPFLGCSAYPECKKIIKLDAEGKPAEGPDFPCGLDNSAPADPATPPNATEYVCPEGRGGVMVLRQSRLGPFLGCSKYPRCRTLLRIDAEGKPLPDQEFACKYSEKSTGRSRTPQFGAARNGRRARQSAPTGD
ncbi:MAG: type I DNA topoisomerase [Chloroherpetonaceae bacterium]|nr:type I DNA topoisomerase [Chthonomonadaceae bacterium]MDW8206915.1 type I DNA topoisomerase [Chloroherpetonaceae bacterium]